ncbi:hypothetical protein ScPMuIL_013711 [Solemya velum]
MKNRSTASATVRWILSTDSSDFMCLTFDPQPLLSGLEAPYPMVLTKAIVSSRTASGKQGAIFCSFSAIETVCQVTSAVIGNGIYSATVNFFSGLVFLLIAVLCLISGALLLVIYLTSRTKSSRLLTEIAVPTGSSQGDDI